jgi:phage terminase large subunit-like protein
MGRISHVRDFPELVSQMIGYDGKGSSPDRLDALVWALTELMLVANSGETEASWIA